MGNKRGKERARYSYRPKSPTYSTDITIKRDVRPPGFDKKTGRKEAYRILGQLDQKMRGRFNAIADRISADPELSKRQKFEAIVVSGMRHLLTRQQAVASATRKTGFSSGRSIRTVSKPLLLPKVPRSIRTGNRQHGHEAEPIHQQGGEQKKQAVVRTRANEFDEPLDFDKVVAGDEAARQVLVSAREGQQSFRERVLAVFDGRCAVTGCEVGEALEAAHIVPYKGRVTNSVYNGLCLRADVHTLFDKCLINLDSDLVIHVDDKLKGSEYWQYNGRSIRQPNVKFIERMKKLIRMRARLVSS